MNPPRAPRIARLLLRCMTNPRHLESLEGDLMEGLAAGRTVLWFWQQTWFAICESARTLIRQQLPACLAAAAFFFLALWFIAPATYPVMNWARNADSLRVLVLIAWLAGVPFLLGGIAGTAGSRLRVGAILLGAALVWLTPVTQPFDTAVCDLCAAPDSAAIPATTQIFTPLGSALLAGLGAWMAGRIRRTTKREQLR